MAPHSGVLRLPFLTEGPCRLLMCYKHNYSVDFVTWQNRMGPLTFELDDRAIVCPGQNSRGPLRQAVDHWHRIVPLTEGLEMDDDGAIHSDDATPPFLFWRRWLLWTT